MSALSETEHEVDQGRGVRGQNNRLPEESLPLHPACVVLMASLGERRKIQFWGPLDAGSIHSSPWELGELETAR